MAGAAPRYAGCQRPHALTLAVYDPAAAEQRASAASLPLSSAFVPFLAPPVYAAPTNAVVTATDLDSQQNRLRLPTAGVLHSLCPLLLPEELDAASIPRNGVKVVPRLPRSPPTEEEEVQQGSIKKRKKKQGKKHGGLPVVVCNVHAGTKQLQLTRWDSSHGNIIKGEGYLDFITRCCFKEKDVVEIWAFKERRFHLFGVDMCHASPLYVVLAKKEQRQPASIGMGKCTM
ncbi:hypothetical protein ZWY2020_004270 [Hordeum vulgare]|nr:hypothetical protein ZWY2020_004270 [Hordeum vulgare]